jgi:predicted RNA-binding protein with PUA-like domain
MSVRDWVKSLKVGDEVAFYDSAGDFHSIVSVLAVSSADNVDEIDTVFVAHRWYGPDGNAAYPSRSTDKGRIGEVTQDHRDRVKLWAQRDAARSAIDRLKREVEIYKLTASQCAEIIDFVDRVLKP